MTTTLVEVSTFSDSVVAPDPTEDVTAESVRVPLQALTNRTRNHEDRVLATELWQLHPVVASTTIITVGDATVRQLGSHDLAVAGNGSTTAFTFSSWPADRQVGRLTCKLVSVEGLAGAGAHYGLQVWEFACRRDGSGVLTVASANPVDVTSNASALEHDLSVTEFSGGVRINIDASATSVDCNCDLIVEMNDGPTWSVV